MKRLLTILTFMMLIFATTTIAYLLVDSEDFQSYTPFSSGGNQTMFLNESNNTFWCSNPPYCTTPQADGAYGIANYTIDAAGFNKYLNIYAFDAYCKLSFPTSFRYYETELKWRSTNSTNITTSTIGTTPMAFILNVTMKIPYIFNYSGCGGIHTAQMQAGIKYGQQLSGGTVYRPGIFVGYSLTSPLENLSRMRNLWTTGSPYSKPASSTCDVNDGNWHQVWTIYRMDSTKIIRNVSTFVDGSLCNFSTEVSVNMTGSQFFISDSNFPKINAIGAYWINLDNISLCEINATADTEQCPLAGTSPTYNCSDGLDNDFDGFIDYPQDPSCNSTTDDSEEPSDLTDCADNVDSDGDGFIDMADDGCTSPFDLSELPFHTTQCNNGIDDDSDGNIDLADPDCVSLTNTTEFGTEVPAYNVEVCSPSTFCLLNEPFNYYDYIWKHGWENETSNNAVASLFGSNQMHVQSNNAEGFNMWKNISNPNTYNNVLASWQLYGNYKSVYPVPQTNTYYVKLRDVSGRTAVYLKFVTVQDTVNGNHQLVYINDGSWEYVGQWMTSLQNGQRGEFQLTIDQVLKKVNEIVFSDHTGTYGYTTNYDWYDATASKVKSYGLESAYGEFNGSVYDMYMDNIGIVGNDIYYNTSCDVYTSPYFLKESFNGYLYNCQWETSNKAIFTLAKLALDTDTNHWWAQRNTDSPLTSDMSEFVTLTYDFKPINYNGLTGQFLARVFDSLGNAVVTVYTIDDKLYYTSAGHNLFTSNFPTLNVSVPYKIVMNLPDGTFDLYVNGTKIVTAATIAQEFLGTIGDVRAVKFESYSMQYELDNVAVYTSDENGVALLPTIPTNPVIDNTTKYCGLIYTNPSTCSVDTDCLSNDCMPNGKCNSFNMNYCDENGYQRTNKCFVAGLASCVMNGTATMVLDNFLLVVVGLLMLMVVVYLAVMLRGRGQ